VTFSYLQMLTDLPVKTLRTVLMGTFLMLYSSDYEGDDDSHPYQSGKSPSSQRRAYTLLSSVCSDWHHTLSRWSSLSTSHWLKCHIKKLKREYMHTVNLFVIHLICNKCNCTTSKSQHLYRILTPNCINVYKSGCLGFVARKKQTLVNHPYLTIFRPA